MKALVVYFSRGGNAVKIAEDVAKELDCESFDGETLKPDLSGVDLLVIGSGTFDGKLGEKLLEFLKNIPRVSNKKAAIFSTCGLIDPPKSIEYIKRTLEDLGYEVVLDIYCFGKHKTARHGQHADDDSKEAVAFARDIKRRTGM